MQGMQGAPSRGPGEASEGSAGVHPGAASRVVRRTRVQKGSGARDTATCASSSWALYAPWGLRSLRIRARSTKVSEGEQYCRYKQQLFANNSKRALGAQIPAVQNQQHRSNKRGAKLLLPLLIACF